MKSAKVKLIFRILAVAILAAEMCVLILEALTPGKESAAQSNAVGGVVDDLLTDLSKDEIKNVPPTDLFLALNGEKVSELSLRYGGSLELTAVFLPENTSVNYRKVIWESDNEEVVSVLGGKLRAEGIGSANITASAAGELRSSVLVTVYKVEADSLKLSFSGELAVGKSRALDIELDPIPTDADIRFSSSRPEIATVDGRGIVKGISPGEATIEAVLGELSDEVTVRVVADDKPRVPIRALLFGAPFYHTDGGKNFIYADESGKVTTELIPADTTETDLLFESSDADVFDIDRTTGAFTAVKKGTALVTVSAAENPTLSLTLPLEVRNRSISRELVISGTTPENTDVYRMTVTAGSPDISISPKDPSLFVRYESGDSSIAEVYPNGVLSAYRSSKGAEGGTVSITVLLSDNENFSEAEGLVERVTILLTVEKQSFSSNVKSWGIIIRKLFGHFGAFFLLGATAAAVLILFDKKSLLFRVLGGICLVAFGFLFAGLTEILQLPIFTTGRGAAFQDVLIDFSGYLPAALLLYGGYLLISYLIKRFKKKT